MSKKKCPECPSGAPKWMTTFSDMVTLLLTFFVLLLSMASFEKIKIQQVFGVLTNTMGILDSDGDAQMTDITVVPKKGVSDVVEKSTEQMTKSIKEVIESQNMQKMVSIVKTDKGISVRIADSAFFKSGSYELLPEAYPVLRKVAAIVENTPYYINIEGHTDDTPVGIKSPNNWDLSTDRAVSVVKQFIKDGFDPIKLSAAGYGEFHPLLPNITPENRAKNRRVEINIVTPEFAESGKNIFE